MNIKDLLTVKTGELLAKADELREANESLSIANTKIRKKIEEIKNARKDLTELEMDLLVANNQVKELNERFALTNKELAKVSKDLIVAHEEIKQLVLKQKEFVDIAAHELRTPIQALSGNFELIEMDIPSLLKNSAKAMETTIKEFERLIKDKPRLEQFRNRLISSYKNSRRLEKLVSDILVTSRIENNKLQLHKEPFNLNEKIQDVINDVLTKTRVASLHANSLNPVDIVFEPQNDPVIVYADKIRIFEVISNIMNNAINFSDGESITVSVTKSQNNDDKTDHENFEEVEYTKSNKENEKGSELVIVSIKDKGKGIDEKILPRLFEKFVTKSDKGIGLGLYISKNIVEAHGGIIWAQNNKNEKGATVSFSLPLRE
ncbi:sensor histidine kinase [Candidatus Nitrosocosmicus franklandus]|uniref:histidine kinase n=1 Tax=Candidatus Nitrosocosmicus franklandianus TaxID=1798806 RepID=A0A484IF70_9ARCH